jgi:hypothetical protein
MSISRSAQVATLLTVMLSTTTMPALADRDEVKKAVTTRVAPIPALGTGLPGLIVLIGGLVAVVRRRRG